MIGVTFFVFQMTFFEYFAPRLLTRPLDINRTRVQRVTMATHFVTVENTKEVLLKIKREKLVKSQTRVVLHRATRLRYCIYETAGLACPRIRMPWAHDRVHGAAKALENRFDRGSPVESGEWAQGAGPIGFAGNHRTRLHVFLTNTDLTSATIVFLTGSALQFPWQPNDNA